MLNITINKNKTLGPVSDMLYGQMVEHAYWSVHKGLCSQLLDNGGFELDRDGSHQSVAQGWQLWSNHNDNQYYALLDNENPYNASHSQKLVVTSYTAGEVVLQQCFVPLKKNIGMQGFIFLRGNIGTVTVSLRGIDKKAAAQQCFQVNHNEWKRYALDLTSQVTCPDGIFAISIESEGTLWVDQAQLYPADDYQGHHTRADIVTKYQALKPTFLRWPGGTYLIWHHWKNAVGPLEDRLYADGRILKDTFGIAHAGEWDPNLFGTDEFIQLCQDCNAAPMLNINLKDTLANALDWLEYCNGDASTPWGAKRAENGHPEPYQVKYWVIDNEPMIIGNLKGFSPELYPILAEKFAREMKQKDPSIEVFIMGNHNTQELMDKHPEFSDLVCEHCSDVMDRLCVHCYYDQSYYAPMQGMTDKLGETLERLKNVADQYSKERDIKVFLSEFNPEANTNIAGNMGQALETARMFNMLERKCAEGIVDMATMCQLCVNVDQYRGRWLRSAMVQVDRNTSWVSPMYHVTRLYSLFRQPTLVETVCDTMPSVDSTAFYGLQIPAVDIVSTVSKCGKKLVLKAVNNDLTESFESTISVGQAIRKITVNQLESASIFDQNTAVIPDLVKPKTFEIDAAGDNFSFAFAPNTVNVIEIAL